MDSPLSSPFWRPRDGSKSAADEGCSAKLEGSAAAGVEAAFLAAVRAAGEGPAGDTVRPLNCIHTSVRASDACTRDTTRLPHLQPPGEWRVRAVAPRSTWRRQETNQGEPGSGGGLSAEGSAGWRAFSLSHAQPSAPCRLADILPKAGPPAEHPHTLPLSRTLRSHCTKVCRGTESTNSPSTVASENSWPTWPHTEELDIGARLPRYGGENRRRGRHNRRRRTG